MHFLKSHHVLVRMVKACINQQGGVCSLELHRLAKELTIWSSTNQQSVHEKHVPGILNREADLQCRGNPLNGEWKMQSLLYR